jgi:hypothetical protein
MAEIGKTSAKGKQERRGAATKKGKTKRKLKGNGADLLRTASERRLAESSEELAQLLVAKAMEGKLESVKMLIKMAEEEKVKKEKQNEDEGPTLNEMLWGSNVRIGQVWDGRQWRRLPKTKVLEAKVVEVDEAVNERKDDMEDVAPRQWNITAAPSR